MENKFIVVNYGTQNKKIAVHDMSHDTLLKLIKERFQVQSPDIKYYDQDVDDWVDFDRDADECIATLKVLKLRVKETQLLNEDENCQDSDMPPSPTQPSTPCRPGTPSINSRPQTPVSRPQTPVSRPQTPVSRSQTPVDRPQTPSSRAETSSRPDTCQSPGGGDLTLPSLSRQDTPSTSSASKYSSKTWCRQYKISKPQLSRSVLSKLEAKEELTTSERRHFLDVIYNDVTKYAGGMYPTSEMYEDVVDGLIREFPYLLTYGGLPPSSAREFWKDKVLYKFGNARKLLDKNHPDVKLRKKKVITEEKKSEGNKNNFTWGLGRYLPDIPDTEDETSLDIHTKWLQREYKKTDQDLENVNRKMDLTFPYRRRQIVEDKISVRDLVELYPWLTSRHELLKEFQRLEPNTDSNDLVELLTEGLQKYRKGIVGIMKAKKKPDFLVAIDEAAKHYRTEGQRNYADDCMALAGMAVLFKEKAATLFVKENAENQTTMAIKVHTHIMTMDTDAFSVFAEDTEVFKCDSFFEAYSGLLACIYVLNLAYPKDLEKSFLFVQNILLGLKDNEANTIDKRIVNVLSMVNGEIKKRQ
ncbi:sterile alpha motif domain-containing protein 3-like isoform X2 [Mytilus edulis]